MYDITDQESFHNMRHWAEELDRFCYDYDNMVIMLVGNRSDLQLSGRQVETEMAESLAGN